MLKYFGSEEKILQVYNFEFSKQLSDFFVYLFTLQPNGCAVIVESFFGDHFSGKKKEKKIMVG